MWCVARVMSLVVRLLTTSNFVLPAKLVCTWDAPSSRGKSRGLSFKSPNPPKKRHDTASWWPFLLSRGTFPQVRIVWIKMRVVWETVQILKIEYRDIKHDGLEKVLFSYKNSSFGICLLGKFGINVEFQLSTWAATLPRQASESMLGRTQFWNSDGQWRDFWRTWEGFTPLEAEEGPLGNGIYIYKNHEFLGTSC